MKKIIILLIIGLMVLTSCGKLRELLNNNKEADNSSLTIAVDKEKLSQVLNCISFFIGIEGDGKEQKIKYLLNYIPFFIGIGGGCIGLCLGAILMLAWQHWHQKPQRLFSMTEEFALREIIAYFYNVYCTACSQNFKNPDVYATDATVNRYKSNIGVRYT